MITRETLRGQARDFMLKQILSGDWKPGELITLSEIAADLGISRTPVREALLALHEQGLVGMGEGSKRFYVWPLSLKESRSLGQLAQVLEALAVRTTDGIDEKRTREMRTINRRLADAQGNPDGMIKWDDRFHDLLVAGTENEELQKMVRHIRKRFHRYRWYGYDYVAVQGSTEKLPSVTQHAEIVDAMERGDMEQAAQLVEEHWRKAIELLQCWLPKSDGFQALRDVGS